jgi:hypothetical protein
MPEYRLLQAHRIDKVLRAVGEEVALPQQLGDWLVAQQIMEPVEGNNTQPPPQIAAPAPRGPKFVKQSPRFSCCGWGKR